MTVSSNINEVPAWVDNLIGRAKALEVAAAAETPAAGSARIPTESRPGRVGTSISRPEVSALTWLAINDPAWTPVTRWVAIVGAGQAEALWSADLVEAWNCDADGRPFVEPMVTLTTYSAWHLGVEVIEGHWRPVERRAIRQRQKPQRGTVSLKHPELLPDKRMGPAEEVEFLLDLESGKPVTLLGGHPVRIDRRVKGPRKAKASAKDKKRARAKSVASLTL
jgi:hypothetical protein